MLGEKGVPMEDRNEAPQSTELRDRSLGLAVFGVVEILMGALCALLIPVMVLATAATRSLGGPGAAPTWREVLPTVVLYGAVAVILVVLGVGSIRARRWARRLLLVLSWLWLITGVVALVASLWLVPLLWEHMALLQELPRDFGALVQITTILLLALVYVALPAALFLFYRSPHVAATCRARDPKPSLIDQCPSRRLSLAVIWGLGALSVLVVPAYGFAFPLFGGMVGGLVGAAAWSVVLVATILLTWGTYRGEPWAWWGGVAVTVVAALSTTLTVACVPFGSLVAWLPADQRLLLEALPPPGDATLVLLSLATWGSLLIFILATRRFFPLVVARGVAD
jgi:hypothetical protein